MSAFSQDTHHLRRLYKATGYSIAGLKATFQYEQAFRLEVYLLLLLIPLAIWLGDSPVEYILLIGSWIIVMITELLNSAIEAAIDRISMEHHELSGRAKDIGSAAVLMSLVLAGGTWVLLLST